MKLHPSLLASSLLLCLPLLTACGDKEVDEDDEGWSLDDTGAACGSTHGFVYGTVTGPYTDDPNPSAQVFAWSAEAEENVEGEMAGDGSYELNVEAGTWSIYATDSGCYSMDVELEVEECQEYPLDIEIIDCDTADKPNLYLYPEADTPMSVRVLHTDRQQLVATAPEHGAGWRGIAHPDGTWTDTRPGASPEPWPFLFYEVSLAPWQSRSLQRAEGWCLPEAGAAEAMAELLGDYGFNARERDDFVDAWVHDLPPSHTGYAVYPQLQVAHAAGLELSEALPVDRLWLVVEEGNGCLLPEPAVVPFERSGPHGVEWGVVLHGLVR